MRVRFMIRVWSQLVLTVLGLGLELGQLFQPQPQLILTQTPNTTLPNLNSNPHSPQTQLEL